MQRLCLPVFLYSQAITTYCAGFHKEYGLYVVVVIAHPLQYKVGGVTKRKGEVGGDESCVFLRKGKGIEVDEALLMLNGDVLHRTATRHVIIDLFANSQAF